MKRIIPLIAVALGAAALTACGSSSQQAKNSSAAPASAPTVAHTVSLASVSGVGQVLVDSKGFALYSPKQDTAAMIRCTGSCTKIWVPLTVKGTPTAGPGLAGKIGTVMRPDGRRQVTFNGKPLYTFAEDTSPKTVNGNGAADQFGSQKFNWTVASVGKTPPSSSGGSGGGGYNYG